MLGQDALRRQAAGAKLRRDTIGHATRIVNAEDERGAFLRIASVVEGQVAALDIKTPQALGQDDDEIGKTSRRDERPADVREGIGSLAVQKTEECLRPLAG